MATQPYCQILLLLPVQPAGTPACSHHCPDISSALPTTLQPGPCQSIPAQGAAMGTTYRDQP